MTPLGEPPDDRPIAPDDDQIAIHEQRYDQAGAIEADGSQPASPPTAVTTTGPGGARPARPALRGPWPDGRGGHGAPGSSAGSRLSPSSCWLPA